MVTGLESGLAGKFVTVTKVVILPRGLLYFSGLGSANADNHQPILLSLTTVTEGSNLRASSPST